MVARCAATADVGVGVGDVGEGDVDEVFRGRESVAVDVGEGQG